jgi:dethiobiotin synthetase
MMRIRRSRPARLVGVLGTNTGVGKTWVSSRVLTMIRAQGRRVAARKPVQSFEQGAGPTDAELLAAATGEAVADVCPPHRSYPVPLAPPMAADLLDRDPILLDEIVREIVWPENVDIGFIETVGGARSPLAHDADSIDLLKRVEVDEVLLVADAALGSLNAIRLTLDCVGSRTVTVMLNRYDDTVQVQRLNRQWLSQRYGLQVLVDCRRWR